MAARLTGEAERARLPSVQYILRRIQESGHSRGLDTKERGRRIRQMEKLEREVYEKVPDSAEEWAEWEAEAVWPEK